MQCEQSWEGRREEGGGGRERRGRRVIYASIFSHGTAGCWKGTPEPCQHLHAAPPQRRPVFHVRAQTRGKHTITISAYCRREVI